MKVLILDDEKYRHEGFDSALEGNEIWHAYDCRQAIKILEEVGPFDVVYLDYNLSKELTGLDAARYIARMSPERRPKSIRIHSWHPTGAWNMQQILEASGAPVINEPFSEAVSRLRREKHDRRSSSRPPDLRQD